MTPVDTDVVVVGAGLAGSVAAQGLARAGWRVLLADRADFPRWKVCGCCLNPVAQSVLRDAGVGDLLDREAVPVSGIRLGSRGVAAPLELPGWRVLSRVRLDSALIAAAQSAGVTFLPGTSARLGPVEGDRRAVWLGERAVRARLVIAADGLAGRLLSGVEPAEAAAGSHIGAGVVADQAPAFYQPGQVYMATGPGGYVGLVRLEDGRLNLAAALNAAFVRQSSRHPGAAAASLLAEVGWPAVPDLARLRWRGTPALTRRPAWPGAERVLAIGDAAGYVEPFTGEGMAWALLAGRGVVEVACRAAAHWGPESLGGWAEVHGRLVRQRQWACRAMAWLLRRPSLTRIALGALTVCPRLAAPFLRGIGGKTR